MIENIIHLMTHDNDGNPLTELNERFIQIVCRDFGGATITEGKGLWYDNMGNKYEDNILRVITAFDPSASRDGLTNNRTLFLNMADQYKDDARQESVYVVIDGRVNFI